MQKQVTLLSSLVAAIAALLTLLTETRDFFSSFEHASEVFSCSSLWDYVSYKAMYIAAKEPNVYNSPHVAPACRDLSSSPYALGSEMAERFGPRAAPLIVQISALTRNDGERDYAPRISENMRRPLLITTLLALSLLAACGGGASGGTTGGGNPPQTPGFSVGVEPMNLSVVIGSSNSVTVSVNGENGFSSEVTVQITGMPAGVSASPLSLSLAPGTPQAVTFSAVASAATFSGPVTFTGTSGWGTHTSQITLSVSGDTLTANTPPSRTRYVRTDATTEYFTSLNSHWIVYNPNASQFYVSDPQSNHVFG